MSAPYRTGGWKCRPYYRIIYIGMYMMLLLCRPRRRLQQYRDILSSREEHAIGGPKYDFHTVRPMKSATEIPSFFSLYEFQNKSETLRKKPVDNESRTFHLRVI